MIEKDKLEKKMLYSKWDTEWDINYVYHGDLVGESINMFCETCDCNQTFNCNQVVFDATNLTGNTLTNVYRHTKKTNGVLYLKYICAHCHSFVRDFTFKVKEGKEIEKIGQYPPIGARIPKEITKIGDEEINTFYKNGRISEITGYGIGAFSYYRRIMEKTIDYLMTEIKEFVDADKKADYDELVENLKKEKTAENRINLVKDTFIDDFIDGNPIKKIYSLLSIGIHGLSDVECLENAGIIRELLIFTLEEIYRKKDKKGLFKRAMSKADSLLSKKSK